MRNSTAIKTQILENHKEFTAIAKLSDVEATIAGVHYRVNISKGEAVKVYKDKTVVWNKDAGIDVLDFLKSTLQPPAVKKVSISLPEKAAQKEAFAEAKKAQKEADKAAKKAEKEAAIAAKKAEKEAKKEAKVKKEAQIVDAAWIDTLTKSANEIACITPGDVIKLRVATSHGKPVCAHVDLWRDNQKVATAGIHHRVGFCTKGINERWTKQVEDAIQSIYRSTGNGNIVKAEGATVIFGTDGNIQKAEGSIAAVLNIIQGHTEA